jgi:hypothetical protein
MTLLFMDGFEDYDEITDLNKKWTTYVNSTTPRQISSEGRFGGECLLCNSGVTSLKYYLPDSTEIICGFAFNRNDAGYSDIGGIFMFYGILYPIGILKLFKSGALQWEGYSSLPDTALSVNVLRPNTWYYIEVRCLAHNTAGEIEIKVDGVTWLSLTGDTLYSTDTYIKSISLPSSGSGSDYLIDDLYILNTSGTKNNDFLGDVVVRTVKPNGAGNYAQFTPSAGSNYQCVDDVEWSDSDSDYVESDTDGEIDTHAYESIPSSGLGEIYGIQLCNGCKKYVESDGTEIKHVVRKNSTDYISDAEDLEDEVFANKKIYEVDPEDSTAWTKAKLDVTEFGYQSVIP